MTFREAIDYVTWYEKGHHRETREGTPDWKYLRAIAIIQKIEEAADMAEMEAAEWEEPELEDGDLPF